MIIAYQTQASNGDIYAVFVNADSKAREFVLSDDYKALLNAEVLADADTAGVDAILNPKGVAFTENSITLNPLTATILRLRKENAETERTLYDQASGVSVILAPGEREEITQIEVHHKKQMTVKSLQSCKVKTMIYMISSLKMLLAMLLAQLKRSSHLTN